jgi:hypothetical protein
VLPAPAPCAPAQPAATASKEAAPPAQAPRPPDDAFAQAPEAGTEAAASYAPNMIGDFVSYEFGSPSRSSGSGSGNTHAPLIARGEFKVADNESPRPLDRVFLAYNFVNNVNGHITGGAPTLDLHLETLGFEKTFMDGAGSVELRLPIFQLTGDPTSSESDVGDLTFLVKYALLSDCRTANVVSAGLAVTVPNGPGFTTTVGDIHSTLLQPFTGYLFNQDNLYFHGFASLVVPTNAKDVTLLFIDNGVGYWLYKGSDGTGIAPTLEAHLNIPLNNEGAFHAPLGFSNEVIITGGIHFLFRNAVLTAGVAFPITGPEPYDVEAIAQFNYRF